MNARRLVLLTVVAALPLGRAAAQGPPPTAAGVTSATPEAAARTPESVLGMTLTISGNERDTLGMLAGVVTPGGPADRGGIVAGSRIAEINGTPLRVPAARVGDRAVADSAKRRLAQILASVRPGSEVSVRAYHSGRYSNVSLRAPGTPEPGSEPAYAAPAAPAAAAVAATGSSTRSAPEATAAPSLTAVLAAMSEVESQLHQLSLAGGPTALGDSLAQAEQEVGDLRLRLRAAEGRQRRHPNGAPAGTAGGGAVAGLRLGEVDKELATYYGRGSETGVLVLDADDSWAPLRAGDVLLTVNGEPASERHLSAEASAHRPVRIDLLRKRKPLSVVVTPRG